jgi:DNA repair protein RadA
MAPPPAAKATEHSGAVHRSRPEMPSLSIGASLETTQAAAPLSDPLPQDDARAPLPTPANVASVPGQASARPPPVDAERSNGASIADTFERLLSSDLDAGFASMQQPAGAPAVRAAVGVDLGEVRALFAQLAANHVRAVRDFVIDLRWSDATVEWVTICAPALQSLRRAAEKLELGDLCRALDKFSDALSAAPTAPGQTIAGERRTAILACYDDLSSLMPQAFALDMDQTQRESIILQSLLLQVPDVKKVTLDKMYAAGLSTLEAMLLATPADIVATTGVAEATAQRIVDRFRTYRAHVKATAPDAARTRERQHIADLASRLRREHDAYERACQHWSREAADQKRELRKVRAQTLLDIQVELARLGEVDRLTQIERLPFEGKLIELESFLEDAREKYVAQP